MFIKRLLLFLFIYTIIKTNSGLFSVLCVYQSKITPQIFYSGNISGMIRGESRGENAEIKVFTGYSEEFGSF